MSRPFLRSSLKAYGTMDKRDFERFPVEAPVKVVYPAELEKYAELLLKSINISAGGILLSACREGMEGKTISLEIELPLGRADEEGKMILIKTSGSVVRSGSEGVAIRFSNDLDIRLEPAILSKLSE